MRCSMLDVQCSALEFHSITHERLNVGTVNGAMASGGPAGSLSQQGGMRNFADVNLTARDATALHLRVAFQAKIRVIFYK